MKPEWSGCLVHEAVGRIQAKKSKENKQLIFPEWVSGSVVFITRKWFRKINGWNEDYWMYYEDVDLSKKVRDHGGEVSKGSHTLLAIHWHLVLLLAILCIRCMKPTNVFVKTVMR